MYLQLQPATELLAGIPPVILICRSRYRSMIHDTTSQLTAMAEDAEVWQIEVNALEQRLKLTLKNSSKPRNNSNCDKRLILSLVNSLVA